MKKVKVPTGMDITNLCNHSVWVKARNDEIIEIPPSKLVARIAPKKSAEFHSVDYSGNAISIHLENEVETHMKGGGLHGAILRHHRFPLPHPKIGHYYIVSKILALYNPERDDLVVPEKTGQTSYNAMALNQTLQISRLYIPAKVRNKK